MLHGNPRAGVFPVVREDVADRCVRGEFAFGDELHDQGRRERFGDGADTELRVGIVRHVPFPVCGSVAVRQDRPVVRGHQDGSVELAEFVVAPHQFVDARIDVVIHGVYGRNGEHRRNDERENTVDRPGEHRVRRLP